MNDEDDRQAAARWLGMTDEQVLELQTRVRLVQLDGYGSVQLDIRRGFIFRIGHTVTGRPIVFKDGKSGSEC